MKKTFVSSSPEETEKIAREISRDALPGDFYALVGDLGAGKTAFARGFVSGWIPDARVTSPTYAILNVYRENDVLINHFDTYRVTSEDDLESTGFFEAIQNGITLCEWPEKIPFALPESYYRVCLEITREETRRITLEKVES